MALNNQLQAMIAQGGVPMMRQIQSDYMAQENNKLAQAMRQMQMQQSQQLFPHQLQGQQTLNKLRGLQADQVEYNLNNPKQPDWMNPEYRKFQMDKARAGASKTNINNNMGPTTPGFKKVDEEFAKTEYVPWKASGGFADVQKNLKQLDFAIKKFETGKVTTGYLKGMLPEWAKKGIDPELMSSKQAVEEVVQRNLRVILGAQFTEKEGERLISRAFDDTLPSNENLRRLKILRKQIADAAAAKKEAMDYFDKNKTLEGFKGKLYTAADFSPDALFDSNAASDIITLPNGVTVKKVK